VATGKRRSSTRRFTIYLGWPNPRRHCVSHIVNRPSSSLEDPGSAQTHSQHPACQRNEDLRRKEEEGYDYEMEAFMTWVA
jgi:hypothetical protein